MTDRAHELSEAVISVSRDFSPYPAGRYRKDGPFSGEAFREDVLVPTLQKAGSVVVNIDGVAGLPSSFWEEVFGGLVRRHAMAVDFIRDHIRVLTTDKSLAPFVRLAYKFADEASHK